MKSVAPRVFVVIPNWNGADSLAACLDSLLAQTEKAGIIVVDNGSTDGSLELLETYPDIEVIRHSENKGYAGGMNPGLQRAMEDGADYIAAFNNDAVADKHWLRELVKVLEHDNSLGVVTCKLLSADGKHIDSTGDYFTSWGLAYPRGRGETNLTKYDSQTEIFGASGGASLYRAKMLQEIGLFDEDFFAYYEDVDLSFRAQLAGWKVAYVPSAIAYHQIGATSSKMKGFATYQTLKNQPLLVYKNVPSRYLFRVGWRFMLAHVLFYVRAISRGQGRMAVKGDWQAGVLLFKKDKERRQIQSSKKVSDEYIWGIMVHDLPPNARNLRRLRGAWWKLIRKQASR